MAQPQVVFYGNSVFSDVGGTNETVAGASWVAEDRILVFGGMSSDGAANQLALPTITGLSGTGLTFTLVTSVNNTATNTDTQIFYWLAVATGSGSGTIQSVNTAAAGLRGGIAAFVFRNCAGVGVPVTLDGSTAKTISVARTRFNSAAVVFLGDFAAIADVAVDATPTGVLRFAEEEVGQATYFVCSFADQGNPGTTAYGITNHTGTVDMSGVAVEVFGADVLTKPIALEILAQWKPQRADLSLAAELSLDEINIVVAASGFTATANITFGALTVASQAAVDVSATLSVTFGALTLSSTATVNLDAQAAFTLGAFTLDADAVVGDGAELTGSITFGALTVAATATVRVDAIANITFGPLTMAGVATVSIEAQASITFGPLSLASVADNGDAPGTPSGDAWLLRNRRRRRL